ncbi:MAG: ABC transporter substrate-binding protein [Dyella sp.]
MYKSLLGCTALLAYAIAGSLHAAEPIKVGVSFQELNNQYFVTMKNALQQQAGKDNLQLLFTDAHHDVLKQNNDIDDLIQQKIKILLINPTDSVGVESAVKAAKAAGIVVVAVDAQAKGPVDSFVGSRNEDAGKLSCDYLAKQIGGKGDVAILDGIPVVPILERVKGCKASLAKYPGIKIVSIQNGKQQRDQAMGVTENILSANPNLKGLFSVNDVGSMGALSAIQADDRDVKLVSVDGAPDAVAEIKKSDSKFIATTAQFPGKMATTALELALKKLNGQAIPAAVPVDVELIDRSKAASFHW